MYNHLSSVINFLQDILCIFMSRDNTRNNHVNCERKTNYIFNMIWNNTDIKHDTCCSNNLLTQHKTGLLSCLICTVRTALFTPVGSSALNRQCCSNRPEQHCWQHCSRLFRTALFTPVDNLQQVVRFYACWGKIWFCVWSAAISTIVLDTFRW